MTSTAASEASYRQILRSSTIFAGASAIQVALGLVRMKGAALLVGVTGVGLIGLLTSFVMTASTLGGLGISTSATREIAAQRSRPGEKGESAAIEALAYLTLVVGLLSMLVILVFRNLIAAFAIGDRTYGAAIGWLSIAVCLTIVASSQVALLAGLRQIAAMARTYVSGAALAMVAGIAALSAFGPRAIIFFVIAVPLASVLAGAWNVARVPLPALGKAPFKEIRAQSHSLARLGLAFMLGQLVGNAAQLAVRAHIQKELGLVQLGLFQAASTIATTYLSVILAAMAADYYPRLSEKIRRPDLARTAVIEQSEVALLLAAPVIFAAMAFAPLALHILYASAFRPAAELLRWQMLGDVLKIASWPLGFVLLAANRPARFVVVESTGWLAFLASTWVLTPRLGLIAPGVGSVLMYCAYLPTVLIACRPIAGWCWPRSFLALLLIVAAAAAVLFVTIQYSESAGAVLGLAESVGFAIAAALRLRRRGAFKRAG